MFSIVIALSGHPVAHTPHPKHRSVLTTGTFASPIVRASGGHLSMQVSQATQRSASNVGLNPELKIRPGLGCFSTWPTTSQCQRSQLHIKSISSVVLRLMWIRPSFFAAIHYFPCFFFGNPPSPQPLGNVFGYLTKPHTDSDWHSMKFLAAQFGGLSAVAGPHSNEVVSGRYRSIPGRMCGWYSRP